MGSPYPTSNDTFTNPSSTSPLNSPDHAGLHAALADAVIAIEQTVGNTGAYNFITTTGGTLSVGALSATGAVSGADVVATGLTGSTAASRYVGATTGNAPTSGTYEVGDWVIDQTGNIWICTAAGTPGTWVHVSGGAISAPASLTASGASVVPLTINGASGQTADLLDLKASGGGVLVSVTATGALNSAGVTNVIASGDTTGATDTAAIQAALTAASSAGGTVILPQGAYYLNGSLKITGSNVRLQAATSTTVTAVSGLDGPMVAVNTGASGPTSRLSNIVISGGTWNHDGTQQTDPASGLAGAITAYAVDGLLVEHLTVENAKSIGINATVCTDYVIDRNTINTVVAGAASNGIDAVGNAATGTAAYTTTEARVTNNVVIDAPGQGIVAGAVNNLRTIISGNIVRYSAIASATTGIGGEASGLDQSHQLVIVGNIVQGRNSGGTLVLTNGILVYTTASGSTGPGVLNTVLSGNSVQGCTNGIDLGCPATNVAGNTIVDCTNGIIYNDGETWASYDLSITGNVIQAGGAGGGTGITVQKSVTGTAALTGLVIGDNICDGNSGGTQGANGIVLTGNLTEGSVTGNTVLGWSGTGIVAILLNSLSPSNVSFTGNRSDNNGAYGYDLTGAGTNCSILGGSALGNTSGPLNIYAGTGYVTGQTSHHLRGYNPVGTVSPSVPASGTAVPAQPYDRWFYITNGAASATFAVSGGPTITLPASAFGTVMVPAGATLTPTYTSSVTWVVEGV